MCVWQEATTKRPTVSAAVEPLTFPQQSHKINMRDDFKQLLFPNPHFVLLAGLNVLLIR